MATSLNNTGASTNLQGASASDATAGTKNEGAHRIAHTSMEKNITKSDFESKLSDPKAGSSEWHEHCPFQADVPGLPNEDVWALIRRFNKQTFHVKKIDKRPLSGLDMNIAAEENITEQKLRAHAERLYASVIIDIVACCKQFARLRSWKERQRTLYFFVLYSASWLANLLSPTLLVFLAILIIYPPARDICFPPAPAPLSSSHVQNQTLLSGVRASESVTGAREKYKGQAVEQEADSFLNSISALLIGISSGKFAEESQDDNGLQRVARDLASVCNMEGHEDPRGHLNGTTKYVSRTVNRFEPRTAMHRLPEFVDSWERISNAMSPTLPLSRHTARLIVGACLLPAILMAYFIEPHMLMKGTGFLVGLFVFGEPVLNCAVRYLDSRCPNWRQYLKLRNTVLRGVPTNAQLAVMLLRRAESDGAPLPPPPQSESTGDIVKRASFAADDLNQFGAFTDETYTPISHSSLDDQKLTSKEEDKSTSTRRVANRIKRTTKDSIRVGHKIAKLAELPFSDRTQNQQHLQEKAFESAGPVRFPARYKDKIGYAYITTTATTPAISWTEETNDLNLAWTVAISNVAEVRKVAGSARKRKALVDWALDRDVIGGLVLKTDSGEEYWLTTVGSRDELFNRVISVGKQIWEIW